MVDLTWLGNGVSQRDSVSTENIYDNHHGSCLSLSPLPTYIPPPSLPPVCQSTEYMVL